MSGLGLRGLGMSWGAKGVGVAEWSHHKIRRP